DGVEDLRLEDVDAGVDGVAEHLAPRGLLEEALDRTVLAGDDDPEVERVLHGLEADGGEGALLLVEAHDGRQVDVGADGAGRAQGRLLGGVDHADTELGPVAEVRADDVGHERHRDHDVLESVVPQEPDDVLHHRPVGQGHHRLGEVGGQGAQAGPLPSRHDDGLHGVDPTRPSLRAVRARGTYVRAAYQLRASPGTAATQARTRARWCHDRSGAWLARNSGKATIRPNVPALPAH